MDFEENIVKTCDKTPSFSRRKRVQNPLVGQGKHYKAIGFIKKQGKY